MALSEDAARRIHMVSPDSPVLRLGVESGGCSGFSYKFDIDDVVATDKDRCGFRATRALCAPQLCACAECLRVLLTPHHHPTTFSA